MSAFSLKASVAGETGPAAYGVNTFGNWEIGATGNSCSTDPVKVFVTIILFDRNYNVIDVAYQASGGSGITMSKSYTVKEPGYAYLYISNEHPTQVNAYFDNVTMPHTPSAVIQTSDYYPFGLQRNPYQRENSTQQNYLFNGGSELQRSLDLGWYQTLFRIYDPAIGRFLQTDPLADFFSGISPYNFAGNNPILYGDPTGLLPTIWQRIKEFFGIGRFSGTREAGNQEYVKPVARNKGKSKPYYFTLRDHPSTPKPKPAPAQPTQQVAEDEPEEEPAIVYIPPAPIYKPKPKPPKPPTPPQSPAPPKADPPYYVKPGGSPLTFNAYQFESRKSDLYHTPANDKLINDLITALKSSSSIHLEIRGNFDEDPPGFWSDPFGTEAAEQQNIANGRAEAIYRALRGAGISASQLTTAPGSIQSTKGQSNEGANMTTTFIITNP